MLKMGGYGLLRFNLPLFPDASVVWAPWIIALSVIAILYGAFVALVQRDFKKLIAYSSVSHMGFVTLGIFIMNMQGMDGAMMVMLAHGFNTGALFMIVGVVYERAHTRDIRAFGGLATRMPFWAGYFSLFLFASIGLPGLSGFVGEFLVTLGTWEYNKLAAIFTFSVVIFAAWYMLWLYQRICFGRAWGELPDPGDTELTRAEIAELDEAGYHGHLGTAAPPPAVAGGDHDAPEHGHGVEDTHLERDEPPVQENPTEVGPVHEDQLDSRPWRDVTWKEHLALAPLAILTIVFGVYPKPVFDIAEPSFQAILDGATRVLGS
jgi:NADH-quinone oxidoreductase subunit M